MYPNNLNITYNTQIISREFNSVDKDIA